MEVCFQVCLSHKRSEQKAGNQLPRRASQAHPFLSRNRQTHTMARNCWLWCKAHYLAPILHFLSKLYLQFMKLCWFFPPLCSVLDQTKNPSERSEIFNIIFSWLNRHTVLVFSHIAGFPKCAVFYKYKCKKRERKWVITCPMLSYQSCGLEKREKLRGGKKENEFIIEVISHLRRMSSSQASSPKPCVFLP